MRPQYIYDALLMPEIGRDEIAVLVKTAMKPFWTRRGIGSSSPITDCWFIRKGPQGWYLSRRIEFSRTDLLPHRQRIYDQQGNVATDAHYQDYKDYAGTTFPSTIEIERPRENYDITLNMVKLEINKALTDDQFALEQPAGADVVHLDPVQLPSAAKTLDQPEASSYSSSQLERHDESHDRRESGASAGTLADQHCGRGARSHADPADRGALAGDAAGSAHADRGHRGRRDRAASGISFIAGLTGSPMPIKVAGILAKLPHVEKVAPVITQVSTAGTLEIIAGIDLPSYESLSGGFHYLEGGPFQGPYDVIVDDLFAQSKHAKVGDTIEILNNKFRICGIVEHGKGGRKFIPLEHHAGPDRRQGQGHA